MPRWFRWEIAAGAGLLVLAAGLRLYRLGDTDLWYDEANAALLSRGDPAQLLANTRESLAAPILYPLLLSLVQRIDTSAFLVRLPSVLFGLGAIGFILALPRVGVKPLVAFAAAALIALGEFQIIYSQETREYALSVLVSAALLYFLCAWTERPRRAGPLVGLAIVSAIAPFASYGCAIAVLGVVGAVALQRALRRRTAGWIAAGVTVAVFAIAAAGSYYLSARYQFHLTHSPYLDEHFLARSGVFPPLWFALNTGGVLLAAAPGLIAAALMALIALAYLALNARTPSILADDAVLIATLIMCAGDAVAGALGLYPFGSPRHSIFLAPFIAVSVAQMGATLLIDRAPPRARMPVLAVAALVVLASAALTFARAPLLAGLHPAFARLAETDVYGPKEEVTPALALAVATPDRDLYVYKEALPAVRFAAPGLHYVAGDAMEPGAIACEIAAKTQSREVSVFFSHVDAARDAAAIVALQAACWRVAEDHVFTDARLVVMARPQMCPP